ncbi:DUF4160 domain-containing protein [Pontibacillus sp. ALD_SL1]|uniref:DUF4160 domain-containing protein n=1 Tax=Pontibacillus sp. ALD_SL1 TaxID=2777185 RepID=UPI001A97608A|nr:DUF4160 domain-containing protein [Pontibacillus sp. ALD_SL1]
MTTISHFGGISIHLYYNDHDPPHFHVNYSGLLIWGDVNEHEWGSKCGWIYRRNH